MSSKSGILKFSYRLVINNADVHLEIQCPRHNNTAWLRIGVLYSLTRVKFSTWPQIALRPMVLEWIVSPLTPECQRSVFTNHICNKTGKMSHILCNVYIVYVNGFYKVEVLQLRTLFPATSEMGGLPKLLQNKTWRWKCSCLNYNKWHHSLWGQDFTVRCKFDFHKQDFQTVHYYACSSCIKKKRAKL